MKSPLPIEVRSVRNGRGLVATRPFARGEIICEIKGTIVTAEQLWNYWKRSPTLAANCFRYGAHRYLNPARELGAFANHSCDPNVGVIKVGRKLYFKSIRTIDADVELTHDYSTLLGADDIWTMACNCGEPCCRAKVQSFHTLPPALVRRYIRLGVIPQFILATRT